MKQWLDLPSVQVFLCTLGYALLAYWTDRWTVLFTSPLYAALMARPVINLIANTRHGFRSAVWLPVHGQHYVFKNTTMQVLEDDEGWRWVKLADVESALGTKLNERVLTATYPDRLQVMGKPARMHIRDDALITHIGKQNDPMSLRFRTWLERNVAFPAERARENSRPHNRGAL
jgi:hypothetical protein